MSNFWTMLRFVLSQAVRFFEEIAFFDSGFRFIDFVITLIIFFVVVRILVLNFWGSGHE